MEPERTGERLATRVERLLGAPLAEDAVRRWPQSGELLRGSARIAEVESHFPDLKLSVTRRRRCGDLVVVEWSTDYGDGRVHRNVTLGELEGGRIVRVTDYWGEPFTAPPWRARLAERDHDLPPGPQGEDFGEPGPVGQPSGRT
jgi:hypothetical protein